MTNQEIFETVSKHLINQGARSMYNEDVCAYHAIDGKMCAVGCLIKAEFYNSDIEGRTVIHYSVKNAVTKSIGEVSTSGWTLLDYLQDLHDMDTYHAGPDFHNRLKQFALEYGDRFGIDGNFLKDVIQSNLQSL